MHTEDKEQGSFTKIVIKCLVIVAVYEAILAVIAQRMLKKEMKDQ